MLHWLVDITSIKNFHELFIDITLILLLFATQTIILQEYLRCQTKWYRVMQDNVDFYTIVNFFLKMNPVHF